MEIFYLLRICHFVNNKIIGVLMKFGSGGTYHSIEDHVDSMRGDVRAVFPKEADDFLSTSRPGEST